MKTTNHFTPTSFYHDFLDWLVRLEPFHDDEYDKKEEEMEKIQFEPDTEAYYCQKCVDDLVENSWC